MRTVKRTTLSTLFACLAVFLLITWRASANDAYGEIVKTKTFVVGGTVELDVNTSMSAEELNVQWFKDGVPLPFKGKSFRKPNAAMEDAGIYTVTFNFCSSFNKKSIVVVIKNDKPTFDLNDGIVTHPIKGLDDMQGVNYGFSLLPNNPNPFQDQTTIRFFAGKEAHVQLNVVDMLGNHVATLLDATVTAGEHQVDFFPRKHNISSGLYYYTLTAPGFTDSKTMMIVK